MGVWIMAGVTFREAARRKILWTAVIAGAAILALFATGLHFQVKDSTHHNVPPLIVHQVQNALLQVGFYAVNLLTVVMTILTSVDTLSGEISSGTIQAIATKPLPRWEILMGKWLGFAGMIAIYLAGMFGGVAAVGIFHCGPAAAWHGGRSAARISGMSVATDGDVRVRNEIFHAHQRCHCVGAAWIGVCRRVDRTDRGADQ